VNLNDLLREKDIDPEKVLVIRHRPYEPKLNRALPWLAAEKPDIFNAYQQSQGKPLERAMEKLVGTGYLASFIGLKPGKALFVALYSIVGATSQSYDEYWARLENQELKKLGAVGWAKEETRTSVLWFDLNPADFYREWRGRMSICWPPPELSFWRRAHKNNMQVVSVLEESALVSAMPGWEDINLSWEELRVLPEGWKAALKEWRAIYYIFDESDRKGYVGSAYSERNLLGRWLEYAKSGHGGNRLLRERNPQDFRFSILQRPSPDMSADDVIRLEASWKNRLHTRHPLGLNDN
jgi:hypothetical protein